MNITSHTALAKLAMLSGRVGIIPHLTGKIDDGASDACFGHAVAPLRSAEQFILHRPLVSASRVSPMWTEPGDDSCERRAECRPLTSVRRRRPLLGRMTNAQSSPPTEAITRSRSGFD